MIIITTTVEVAEKYIGMKAQDSNGQRWEVTGVVNDPDMGCVCVLLKSSTVLELRVPFSQFCSDYRIVK